MIVGVKLLWITYRYEILIRDAKFQEQVYEIKKVSTS